MEDLVKNNKFIINVLDVDGSFVKGISVIFDPQEKIKLITFEDRLTKEKNL
ncbi:MAG: hypothetical protein ACKO47_05835 [Alphaproteobacteria bacterium]